jgi:hypothetical protein
MPFLEYKVLGLAESIYDGDDTVQQFARFLEDRDSAPAPVAARPKASSAQANGAEEASFPSMADAPGSPGSVERKAGFWHGFVAVPGIGLLTAWLVARRWQSRKQSSCRARPGLHQPSGEPSHE